MLCSLSACAECGRACKGVLCLVEQKGEGGVEGGLRHVVFSALMEARVRVEPEPDECVWRGDRWRVVGGGWGSRVGARHFEGRGEVKSVLVGAAATLQKRKTGGVMGFAALRYWSHDSAGVASVFGFGVVVKCDSRAPLRVDLFLI